MTSPESRFPNLGERLLEHTSVTEFSGLTEHSALIHEVYKGDSGVCVAWTLSASHGTRPHTSQDDIARGSTFLGWHATGRPVRIPVVSIAPGSDPLAAKAGEWHHQWDRLGALAQIGVRAVGRPVLRTDNALDR
jgi:hypothetical protein